MFKSEAKVRVRYKETDQMGMAYHANYLVWFEVGRTELMRKVGMPYAEFEKSGLFLPVLKVFCEYKHAVSYDDLLTIITRLDQLGNVRLTFHYEIRKEEKLHASGYTEHAFINMKGRPVALKSTAPFYGIVFQKHLKKKENKGGQNG